MTQLAPYTPSLYQPGSFGRFRQYPREVDTPIPGAGYDVGALAWAEQELNLDGGGPPEHYGNYRTVPLRGLGQTDYVVPSPRYVPAPFAGLGALPVEVRARLERMATEVNLSANAGSFTERLTALMASVAQLPAGEAVPPGLLSEIDRLERDMWPQRLTFLGVSRATTIAAAVGVVVVGGGAAWWFLGRKRKVRVNRRRRRVSR